MRIKFLLGVIGRVTPLTLAFLISFFAPTEKVKVWAYGCGIALLITAEYFGIYQPLQNIEETRKKQLDLVLKKWLEGVRVNRRKPKLRINVMLTRWFLGKRFRNIIN
jgi:hypothetical protein